MKDTKLKQFFILCSIISLLFFINGCPRGAAPVPDKYKKYKDSPSLPKPKPDTTNACLPKSMLIKPTVKFSDTETTINPARYSKITYNIPKGQEETAPPNCMVRLIGKGGETVTSMLKPGGDNSQVLKLPSGNYVTKMEVKPEECKDKVNIGCGAIWVTATTVRPKLKAGTYDNKASGIITATGGAGGYKNFAWWLESAKTYVIGQKLEILKAGKYKVTAEDKNGCRGEGSVTIERCKALAVSIVGHSKLRRGEKGSAIASATSYKGKGPVKYSWDTLGHDETKKVEGLEGGKKYTVTATDTDGCSGKASITLVKCNLFVDMQVKNYENIGKADGSAIAIDSGGDGVVKYLWSNNQTGKIATNLEAGEYEVTVSDEKGCEAQGSVEVGKCKLSVNTEVKTFANEGRADGGAIATSSGGTGIVSYKWSDGQTGSNATKLTTGKYTVTVSDQMGCIVAQSVNVAACKLQVTAATNAKYLSGGRYGVKIAILHPTATGAIGGVKYKWSSARLFNKKGDRDRIDTKHAGIYKVDAQDEKGCTATAQVQVKQCLLKITASRTDVNFFTGSGGSIKLSASNNIGTVKYKWRYSLDGISKQATGDKLENLKSGRYSVYAEDSAGCIYDLVEEISKAKRPRPSADGAQTKGQ